MKKIIMVLLIALFVFPVTIFAEKCDDTEIVRLKTAASKTEAKLVIAYYPKIMHSDDADEDYIVEVPYVKIALTNLSSDLNYEIVKEAFVLWDSKTVPPKDGAYTYPVLDTYDSIRTFELITKSKNCDMGIIKSDKITIPMLNPYRDYNACSGAKDFYLCQELWYQDYTSYKFVDEVNKFKNNEIDKNGKKKEKKSFLDKINDFVKKNYIILIIVLGVIIGFGVVMFVRRQIRMKKHFG